MATEGEMQTSSYTPSVDIYVRSDSISAAAEGEGESRLSPEQIAALQQTVTSLISGFRPPEARDKAEGLQLDSLEVELSLKVETGAGSVLKLLLDASAEASIVVKVVWK